MLCCAVLCCVVPCRAVLWCDVLFCGVLDMHAYLHVEDEGGEVAARDLVVVHEPPAVVQRDAPVRHCVRMALYATGPGFEGGALPLRTRRARDTTSRWRRGAAACE